MTTDRAALISDVAALYVDRLGPYPKLVEHWWDEQRDARTYAGPWPVVAHPPCGPWSSFRHMYRGDEHDLAPAAVEQVRRWGGVLEHPAGSQLWRRFGLPLPDSGVDAAGGYSIAVDQLWWGHACSKPTWIYCVNVPIWALNKEPPFPHRRPTHDLMGSRGKNASADRGGKLEASKEIRRRTPVAFAEWLISLAQTARPR